MHEERGSCFPELSFCVSHSLVLRLHSAPSSITVDSSLLQWSLGCGTIPLVCPVGRDVRGCSVILNSTEVTAAVSRALEPHKVMFLNTSGGLLSQEHKVQRSLLWMSVVVVAFQSDQIPLLLKPVNIIELMTNTDVTGSAHGVVA